MKKISVWASGNGSNAENLINCFQNHSEIVVEHILTNNPEAGVIERAKRLNIPCFVLSRAAFRDGSEVLNLLSDVQFVVLSGFLQLVPANVVQAFPNAIINIHPALLPNFGGKGMFGHHVHEAAIAAGVSESGITIHLVDEVYDNGKILLQKTCPVLPGDTPDTLAARVHELEYEWFPVAVENYIVQGK